MTFIRSSSLLVVASLLTGLTFHNIAAAESPTVVFANGSDGYNIFRIPALVMAANGDLLAFCEAREGGDASRIDLVLKRSTDAGKTWGKVEMVKSHSGFSSVYPGNKNITVGNPAPVVDQLDPEHAGRIWLPFTVENDRVFVTYSDDHGRTWSKHRDITADVKRKGWGWYATGPVHSIQLTKGKNKGRLVTPCDHRIGQAGRDAGALGAHAIYSDDHGKTWRLGAIDDTYTDGMNANETTVVQLNSGQLYFNTRNQNGKTKATRGEVLSSDGGETFEVSKDKSHKYFTPCEAVLDPPVVQCCLLRAKSTKAGDKQNLILFSGPDTNGPNGAGRSDLRIRYSTDECETWQDGPLLHSGPAAYSDMVVLEPGKYGVLFEAGKSGTRRYDQVWFTMVTATEIMNSK